MGNSRHNPLPDSPPSHKFFTSLGNLTRATRTSATNATTPVHQLTDKELFAESSRISTVIENINTLVDQLVQTKVSYDLYIAADLQTYRILQEGKLVAIQAQILATRAK